jgi:2-polyprenyl-3-methyl-5-hydroxy-6-metoxy-1,4-benzoquinol methylase
MNEQKSIREDEIRPERLKEQQQQAFLRDIAQLLQPYCNDFVSVCCPACGGTENHPYLVKYDFQFVCCKKCETIFMTPRPTQEILQGYYQNSENYRFWAEHIFVQSEEVRREKIHKPRLQKILDLCTEYGLSPEMVVEVGPGFGTFLRAAVDSGRFKRIVGIEPNPLLADHCRSFDYQEIEIINQAVENIGDDLKTPLLVCFEVIEHLFDPAVFISRCHNFLTDDGLFFVTCPNGKGFDVQVASEYSTTIDAEHINLFNPEALRFLLDRCGFEVLECITPGALDAELVRQQIQAGNISPDPFLKRVLVDEWEKLGGSFQTFLAENGLSSHMWTVARKKR